MDRPPDGQVILTRCRGALLTLFLLFGGCATVPKPAELVSLEQLRDQANLEVTRKAHAQLVKESDEAYQEALQQWKAKRTEMVRHLATLSSLKLRTALAIVAQGQTEIAIDQAETELGRARTTNEQLNSKVEQAKDTLDLYEQLAVARTRSIEKDMELSEAHQKAAAWRSVASAQLALKLADTVQAGQYAADMYGSAQSMVEHAQEELDAGRLAECVAAAGLAKVKAEQAYEEARPQSQQASEAATRCATTKQLLHDAGALEGVWAGLRSIGQTQRVVFPIARVFSGRRAEIRRQAEPIIEAVAALLKRYPSYPVLVRAYLSAAIPQKKRELLARTRAQALKQKLVELGLSEQRLAVEAGSGSPETAKVAKRRTSGRSRVEVSVLFE